MKLKPIPENTVVHTPTEAEAEELLAILHENGYRWCGGYSLLEEIEWETYTADTCYYISHYVEYGDIKEREVKTAVLTLADFKRLYCEQEKPQPKFKVGDKVKTPLHIGIVTKVVSNGVCEIDGFHLLEESDLEPYTEPETKPAEDMETKELNLCELIGDRDGIHVYCPTCGEVTLQAWDRGKNTKPLIFAQNDTSIVVRTFANGKAYAGGECVIFPSRALYEQYPLDAYAAWMKWQEERKKHWVSVGVWIDDPYTESDIAIDTPKIFFKCLADRDKCIAEIKAIIEKYNKK